MSYILLPISLWQRVYGVQLLQSRLERPRDASQKLFPIVFFLLKNYSQCQPKTIENRERLSLFSSRSCPIPTQSLLHMMQDVAVWIAPFSCCQHSPPPPLKFLHTLPSHPTSSSIPYVHES